MNQIAFDKHKELIISVLSNIARGSKAQAAHLVMFYGGGLGTGEGLHTALQEVFAPNPLDSIPDSQLCRDMDFNLAAVMMRWDFTVRRRAWPERRHARLSADVINVEDLLAHDWYVPGLESKTIKYALRGRS